MDKQAAIESLGLKDVFSPVDLSNSYKRMVENVNEQLYFANNDSINDLANQLYECSEAFLTLLSEINGQGVQLQPLIIFTDASVKKDVKHSAIGIVVNNIPFSFNVPTGVLKKYNIRIDPESSEKLCIFTGEILNYNVDVAEIMAILAAVEIFKYLAMVSKQKMVIYTDSLTAKKILSDKRLPPGSKLYSGLRKQFLKIVKGNNFDVVIKKVEAHSGIEMNEIDDQVAKNRLSNN